MASLTRDIGTFISSCDGGGIPPECREAARVGMTDCVAVMIAGADEPAVRLAAGLVSPAADGGVPEIPSGRPLAPLDAVLVNGVAAHVLDYDDVALDGHTSAALTPAILAEGMALGADGATAVEAYAIGYEVWARLVELEPGAMHERGFHPTALWGTLAAAAACARLNRLDAVQSAHAVAIAASLASGLVANFGTMTKSLHAGRAAQGGVMAARLAAAGYTGSLDAIEHPVGLLRAHSPSGEPRLDFAGDPLGGRWRLAGLGVNVKQYPICYATHRSIDAMLDLVRDHGLTPNDVAGIEVRIGETQRLMLRNRSPKTGLEAKFSMEFAMASALVAGQVGLRQLTDEFVGRADVVEAMTKVTVTTTAERMADMPFAPADEVAVVLRSGGTIRHDPVALAKGSWGNRLSDDELRAKFIDCVGDRLGGGGAADRLFDSLMDLDRAPSLCGLAVTVGR
ncbi:MmgE/PrpD family protein [Skermanella mucosa]|uniref:MmgE/PrpD family protein n=1 Tax=Skermanella mucosa TaxID=1789672 RepID=UPI00192C3F15|nr:MmgE/PrpD family protein [Skermanella mucosa]UEM19197.1 MmgE/PrpD family protein [Skermanella mucosa]